MNVKMITLATVCLAAALAALSVLLFPWAEYGNIDVPLRRLPNWGVHLGGALIFYAALTWLLVTPSNRRGPQLVVTAGAAVVAWATTAIVALGYDNASAIFPGAVPMVVPHLGLGPFVAALAVLVGLVSAGTSAIRRRQMVGAAGSSPPAR
ncbi:hypothetical protein [Plantactinospora sonchi]|uniref:Uncharacterized protein n=1 Tax=Plantactinospora sonchi TaxID=1544735 RepID=A0ABU7RNN3_9ACTN